MVLGLGVSAGYQIANSTLYYNGPTTNVDQNTQESTDNKYSTNQEVAKYISDLSEEQCKFISNAFFYTFYKYKDANNLDFSSTDLAIKNGKLYVFDCKSTKTYKSPIQENQDRSYTHNMHIKNITEYDLTKDQEDFMKSFLSCERFFRIYEEGNLEDLEEFKKGLGSFASIMKENKNDFLKAMSRVMLGSNDLDSLLVDLSEIMSPYLTEILKNEKSYNCDILNSVSHDLQYSSDIEKKEDLYTMQDLTSFFDQTINNLGKQDNIKTK